MEFAKNMPYGKRTKTVKILGISIYSVAVDVEVDEESLYNIMEKRFEEKMIKALDKAQGKIDA